MMVWKCQEVHSKLFCVLLLYCYLNYFLTHLLRLQEDSLKSHRRVQARVSSKGAIEKLWLIFGLTHLDNRQMDTKDLLIIFRLTLFGCLLCCGWLIILDCSSFIELIDLNIKLITLHQDSLLDKLFVNINLEK